MIDLRKVQLAPVYAIGADNVAHRTIVTYCGGGHVTLCKTPAKGTYFYAWALGGLPQILGENASLQARRVNECPACKLFAEHGV